MRTFIEGTTYYGSAFDQSAGYTVLRYIDKPEHNGGAMLIETEDGQRFYLSAVNYTLSQLGISLAGSPDYGTHETLVMKVKDNRPEWGQPLLQLTGIADLHTVAIMFLAQRQAQLHAAKDYITSVANEHPDWTVEQLLSSMSKEEPVGA